METADLRDSHDPSKFWRLHSPRFLTQGEVRSRFVIQPVNSTPIILNRAMFITPGIPGMVAGSGFTESASGECSGQPGAAWNRRNARNRWKFRLLEANSCSTLHPAEAPRVDCAALQTLRRCFTAVCYKMGIPLQEVLMQTHTSRL